MKIEDGMFLSIACSSGTSLGKLISTDLYSKLFFKQAFFCLPSLPANNQLQEAFPVEEDMLKALETHRGRLQLLFLYPVIVIYLLLKSSKMKQLDYALHVLVNIKQIYRI